MTTPVHIIVTDGMQTRPVKPTDDIRDFAVSSALTPVVTP